MNPDEEEPQGEKPAKGEEHFSGRPATKKGKKDENAEGLGSKLKNKAIDEGAKQAGLSDIKKNAQKIRDAAQNPTDPKKVGAAGVQAGKTAAKAGLTAAGVAPGLSDRIVEWGTSKKFWTRSIIFALILIASLFSLFAMFDNTFFDVPSDNKIQSSLICVPAQINLKDNTNHEATCTLRVTYDGSALDIIITDTILPGSIFVSSAKGTYDKNTQTITWDLAKLNYNLGPPIDDTVVFTVKAVTNNTNAYNYYQITPQGLTQGNGGSAVSIGGKLAANNNTCGGKYSLNSPFKNFGDPQCDFTVNKLGTELRQLDQRHAVIWDCMASHESGYNPNAYNPNSTSGFGAFGLFQMNPQGKGNGKYDNGTVNWQLQASNAINYNKIINGSFAYWATYAGCH